jgi:tetratricopeptide (TPR) repeat protein
MASANAAAPDTAAITDLAAAALSAFTAADLNLAAACLSNLHSLATATPPDLHVQYNTAVLNFYREHDCRDASSLVAATIDLLPEALQAGALRSPLPAALDLVSSPYVLTTLRARAGFIPIFNAAIVAYHSGALFTADKLATFLFSHVEAMEEDWLAMRTCFLLVDILLKTGQLNRVAGTLAYVEGLFASGAAASSRFTPVAPPWRGSAVSVMTLPKTPSEVLGCMHLYAARFGAAQCDAKLLKKESKSAVVSSNDDGSCPTAAALLIKAKFDLSASKALRVMESIDAQSPVRVRAAVRPLLLNNLGVIHHRLGRHALAALYLEQSRSAFSRLFISEGVADKAKVERPLLTYLARARDTHVAYNLGLQHMQLGHFRSALKLFSECARSDEVLASQSSMLWIRIAECCVAEASTARSKAPIAQARGRGQHRRYILRASAETDLSVMQYATMSARAALAIMDRSPVASSATAADDVTAATANRHRCAALALIAYTTLHFDPAAAIVACDELVSCSRPGDSDHAVLGRLYGAEALCLLGRPDEAVERLAPLLAMSGAGFSDGREGAFVNAALAHTLRGDMSAALRAAKAALKVTVGAAANGSPRRNAIAVAAYVSLRNDNVEAAKHILSASR